MHRSAHDAEVLFQTLLPDAENMRPKVAVAIVQISCVNSNDTSIHQPWSGHGPLQRLPKPILWLLSY